MSETKYETAVYDGATATPPASADAPTPNLDPTTYLYPSAELIREGFEYGGQVARDTAEPLEVRLCDTAYLLRLGFTLEEVTRAPDPDELAELLATPPAAEAATPESAELGAEEED